jgi:hypothetical protein
MTCEHCNDTGSLSKDVEGFLDCTHCETASERVMLESWAGKQKLDCGLAALWAVYQHGKAAAVSHNQ